ncbi:hypothetical protein H4I96_09107 [Botrytis cinerea]
MVVVRSNKNAAEAAPKKIYSEFTRRRYPPIAANAISTSIMSSTTPVLEDPFQGTRLPRSPITQSHMEPEPEQAEGPSLLGEGVNTGSRGKGKGRDTMPQPPAEDRSETLRLLQSLAASMQELHGRISNLEIEATASRHSPSPALQPQDASDEVRGHSRPEVLIPSIERDSNPSEKRKKPRHRRRNNQKDNPSESSESISSNDDRSKRTRFGQETHSPQPTNLTSKLKDGIEPKANLWLLLVSERLELYESSLVSESQRRSYVVDQTEGEAQEHILALYMQTPKLTGQELANQLAAIYRNPAEVDHARTEYEHWVMPNTSQRGNFIVWYRKFRLLATQAEITDQPTLLRDLDRKISDFLARAVALHRKSCTTVDALADKLTEIDELEVSIRERNRYRPAREIVKKSGVNANSSRQTPYSYRPTPTGYTGSFKPNPTNSGGTSYRPTTTPAPGTARSPAPRATSFSEVTVVQEPEETEDFHDAEEDMNLEAQAEAIESAHQAEEQRLNHSA